jgi:hypothetical protein
MVSFCAVCGCCTRTDIVKEHLEDTLRICDVSAKGLYRRKNRSARRTCVSRPNVQTVRSLLLYGHNIIVHGGMVWGYVC